MPTQANGNPPLPLTLAQATASILESRDKQTELLRVFVANSNLGGNGENACSQGSTTYSDFLATHPPTFTEAGEPLEANNWLQTIESKFGLLRCMEN
jgi:hypothetical protein